MIGFMMNGFSPLYCSPEGSGNYYVINGNWSFNYDTRVMDTGNLSKRVHKIDKIEVILTNMDKYENYNTACDAISEAYKIGWRSKI